MIRPLITLWVLIASVGPVSAHEVRPGFLQVIEDAPATYTFVWRRPSSGTDLSNVSFIFPDECSMVGSPSISIEGQSRSEAWRIQCVGALSSLEFSGLSGSENEVFVDARLLDYPPISALLRSGDTAIYFGSSTSNTIGYFVIGVEHLIFGIDHVLFVICLFLFVRKPITLVQTLTAFTLAHSLTLGVSVLDIVHLPQRPVEALIALSILFLCREFMLPDDERSSLTQHAPWIMAFGFGLVHGFGFAGALGEIGLPQDKLLLSLFLFNVGVEAGQLLIVAGLAMLSVLAHIGLKNRTRNLERAVVFITGCYAAFWTIERTVLLV